MKVIVTGGTGFIGGRVVSALMAKGHEVHVVSRSVQPDLGGVFFHKANLAKEEIPKACCKDAEAVFHIAAKAGIWGSAQSYHAANVLATRRVLEACGEHGIKALVHTSSPSVVFSSKAICGGNESLPYGRNWLCHYPRTKALSEKEVLEANDPGGLRTIALRPHLVWGPGDPHLLPKAVERHKRGKLRIVGCGQNRMDMTHVANVAHAHLLAMEALTSGKHAGGKAYFISQDEPIQLWTWLNEIFKSMNLPPLKKAISFRKAYSLGLGLETLWKIFCLGGEPPMTRFVALQLAKDHWFSTEAARKDLGYEPIVSMQEGLGETISYLKKL